MAATKAIRKSKKESVLIVSASPERVRKALRLLDAKERNGGNTDRAKTALRLLDMMEKFVKSGGRFKRPFTRKKKDQKTTS